MSIAAALKEVGRGKVGARDLPRPQAAEVWGQILRGEVSDLALGAFCMAMRLKGESTDEMLGFLDATEQAMDTLGGRITGPGVVLPCYNGARRLPALTPLLALLLAQRGLPVLLHGMRTEDARVHSLDIVEALGVCAGEGALTLQPGTVTVRHTAALHPGLARVLSVRRATGLRNSAHSLVKLLQPCRGRALVVASYTHPEYAHSMAEVLKAGRADALLLRGLEGEPVCDPRRAPAVDAFEAGQMRRLWESPGGSLLQLPSLPTPDLPATVAYTERVLQGREPLPAPIERQVQAIEQCLRRLHPLHPEETLP